MGTSENSAQAIDVFRSYTQAFQALDPHAAAQYFNEPALLNSPEGIISLSDRAAVERAYAEVMKDLPKRGYARTEFSPFSEHPLGSNLVVVSGQGKWLTKNGDVLAQFGLMYTLRRSGALWRIVVATIYRDDTSQS